MPARSRFRSTLAAAVAAVTLHAAPAAAQGTLLHSFDFTSGLTSQMSGATGTLVGNASLLDGYLHLTGGTAYAEFAPLIPVSSGAYTQPLWSVSVWARQRVAQPEAVTIVGQGNAEGRYMPDYNISIGAASNGAPGSAYAQNRSGWGGGSFASTGSTLGEWHHYVTVGSWNWIVLYVDGVAQFNQGNGMYPCCYTSQELRLGRQPSNFGGQFDGDIDDLRIYSGQLTDAEIRALLDTGRSGAGPNATVAPEPATYTLLGAGLVLLTATMRRRRDYWA